MRRIVVISSVAFAIYLSALVGHSVRCPKCNGAKQMQCSGVKGQLNKNGACERYTAPHVFKLKLQLGKLGGEIIVSVMC